MKPIRAKTTVAVAWLVAGALLGASMVETVTSGQRIRLIAENERWRTEAKHWQRQWAQLRDQVDRANRAAARHLVVESIRVSVLHSPVAVEAVRGALDPLTSVLLGMPLAGAKVDVLYEMFEGRVLLIRTKLYRVHVLAFLLATESQLLVQLMPLG